MMVFWVVFYGLLALALFVALVRGLFRMAGAAKARDWERLRALSWAAFRFGLTGTGAAIIAATQGRGYKVALVLLIISMATRVPNDLRVLRGERPDTGAAPPAV